MKATTRVSKLLSLSVCLAVVLSLLPVQSFAVQAVSPDVVISQVYGGGGNTGAQYKNDFIELFNRGTTPVSLSGWSVQYASGTGTGNFGGNPVTLLSGILQPGQYYLVQQAAGTSCSGGPCGVALPTPDATGTVNMSGTGAKVALVTSTAGLACNGSSAPCNPTQLALIKDLIGWDGANFFEGAAAPTTSNTTADFRNNGGCTDTDNNGADFTAAAPSPRNTASAFHFCTGPTNPSGVGAATPNAVFASGATVLTMVVTPGNFPTSTGLTVNCDLTSIGGTAGQTFYDDGTNGDVTAGDNTFTYATTVAAGLIGGPRSLACTISDAQIRTGTAAISLDVIPFTIGLVNGPVLDTEDGTTHASPFVGKTVTVQGVIYEKTLQAISGTTDTYKGFYIQNTTATADSDPKTSDGLFVFMNKVSTLTSPDGPYTPAVGDEILIQGKISEYYNMTELGSPLTVLSIVRSGADSEIIPAVADPPVNLADANRYWERLQGMRVQVPQDSIVLGGRNVFSPADAEIWVARSDSTVALRDSYASKAFRDAHILDDNYDPNNWDGNGYRILMGSLGIKAAVGDAQALIDPARSYDTVTNAPSGGLNYTFSKYRIEVSEQPTFSEGPDPAANNPPSPNVPYSQYSIVDYNLENLYDYRDNPFSGCDFAGNPGCSNTGTPFLSAVTSPFDYVPASDEVYQARLTDIAKEIINDLHSPDILMVQEVENQDICSVSGGALVCDTTNGNPDGKPDILQELGLKIASLGGPAYDAAFDPNSSDLRGIAPAFLDRTDRVELRPAAGDPVLGASPAIDGYTPVPYDSDVSNPKTLNAVLPAGITACETSWVFPRAPDIALFRIYSESVGTGHSQDVYVINNHFKSGPDTCVAHRTEQAKYNAALVAFIQSANPNARIVVGGDLNVYPRPDDPFAPIGQPTSSDQLGSLYNASLNLTNLWDVLLSQKPESAYSYIYLGQAQTLDQMFINQAMLADLAQFRIAHINSDFPADYPGDVARGTSDHDPNVAIFTINKTPIVNAVTVTPEPSKEGGDVTASATFSDPEDDAPFTCTVNYGDRSGDLAGAVNGSTCNGPAHAYATFGTYTVTVSVTDAFKAKGSNTASHVVIFNWAGFFQPVDNQPTLNLAKAGAAIPVKFSLDGDKGLAIFADGYPLSQSIKCDNSEPVDDIEQTVTAGASSLAYDPLTGQYTYIWKTDKTWIGTCRQLIVVLIDGTTHLADFKFK